MYIKATKSQFWNCAKLFIQKRSWKVITALNVHLFLYFVFFPLLYFRFASRRYPCCSAGGCTHLCPAGRLNVVFVQEELSVFSWDPHKLCTLSQPPCTQKCLLQTNQLSSNGVGRKCADYRPGDSLGRIASALSLFTCNVKCPTVRVLMEIEMLLQILPFLFESGHLNETKANFTCWSLEVIEVSERNVI